MHRHHTRPNDRMEHDKVFYQIQLLQGKLQELTEAMAESEKERLQDQTSEERRQLLRAILRFRVGRERIFGGDLFGEPAWDMLLELYEAELRGKEESVTSLCIGARVPATTALRWLRTLEVRGWVERRPDQRDRRRSFIHLADKARDALEAMFSELNLVPKKPR